MKYAYVDNIKREAETKLRGICPKCGEEVIAKCGNVKVAHWAHKTRKNCDEWWENETQWHRMWKGYFPEEWQEVIMHDEVTGEKHIADVCTVNGKIIEFQHSFMKADERISREIFYKNMIWVVDGTRLMTDAEKFRNACNYSIIPIKNTNFAYTLAPENYFNKNWIDSSVPVFFDFCANDVDHNLFCLMPGRVDGKALILIVTKRNFISLLHKGDIFDAEPKEYLEVFKQGIERQKSYQIPNHINSRAIRSSKRL